jgi:hypothetical protein
MDFGQGETVLVNAVKYRAYQKATGKETTVKADLRCCQNGVS